jgi:uncharacterized protein YecT (DUF1311 family)
MIRGRETWGRRGKMAAAFIAPVAGAVALSIVGAYQSCKAVDTADAARDRTRVVPAIAKEAAKTDVELDAAYKALAAKVTDIETRLDAALKREVLLEQLVLEISQRHPATRAFRRSKPPTPVAKGPPLPASPAAAVEMPAETIRVERIQP